MDNYPLGADYDDRAPWKQEILPEEEIEVEVIVTLQKKVKIKVQDYQIQSGIDTDGEPYVDIDYSTCDIYRAAQEQLDLNFKDWNVVEFDVFK